MKTADIINAYARIRTIDHTIPDEVLDFMKESAIERLSPQFAPSPKEISEEEIERGLINIIRKTNVIDESGKCFKDILGFILSLPSSGSKTEEVELPEDVQVYIDGIERIKGLIKNGKYSYAEKTKQELINKLNDLV